jgi:hypothetical protein
LKDVNFLVDFHANKQYNQSPTKANDKSKLRKSTQEPDIVTGLLALRNHFFMAMLPF